MLAAACIKRLDLDISDLHVERLDPTEFIPAPAQGVLGLQIRSNDLELREILSHINDSVVSKQIWLERKILNLFGGGCQMPLGAYCEIEKEQLKVWSSRAQTWDSPVIYAVMTGNNPEEMAAESVRKLSAE